jgi:hypothetical protein
MQPGASWADDPLILVFGNIWIVIQLVLDVEAGRRAPEVFAIGIEHALGAAV